MNVASRLCLFSCFALLASAARAAPAPGQHAQGLPPGGSIDQEAVIASHYGATSRSPAPAMPHAAAAPEAPPVKHAAAAPELPAGGITRVTFDSAGGQAQSRVPATFGQVFAPGDVKAGEALAGRFADGSTIPLQVDVKATHPDGSVRHAVISLVLPKLAAGQSRAMAIVKARSAHDATAPNATPQALLASGFSASVSATIDGKEYSASAAKLLARQEPQAWLRGPVATEWLVSAPLATAGGEVHPHLSARFAIRWYRAIGKARVDVTVENDWAFQPGPRNFTYDAKVLVGGKEVYTKPGLTHLHHARWRKVFWWGGEPALNVRHDTRYLIASRALPNYDPALVVPDSALAALDSKWRAANTGPMGSGLAKPYMPTTGGREDIGLLPGWAVLYLLSMDPRAKEATLGTADLAGSYSSHYRDQRTGHPLSLLDYPYMTIVAPPSVTRNPATGKSEAFPRCASKDACATPYTHDAPHQPGFAYLPYLVTGDYYYLEELQFWAMWNVFSSNPNYRDYAKGLVKPDQLRGQAWSLRTLAEAAYITPDKDPLKDDLTRILTNNLDWFNANYTDNPKADALGAITNGYALTYKNKTGVGPWQDDFFTAAVGHAADLGFAQAARLLAWKARFPVARMVGKGSCWILASMYTMQLRDSATSPFYATIGQAYRASVEPKVADLPCGGPEMASALKLRVGEMVGYSTSPTGFPSNMQPALAYAAGVAGQAGKDAWARFMARSVKPDYGSQPQFAIVPR